MFNGCTALESVTVPKSVTRIGDSVFRDCSSLKSISIPDAVLDNPNYGISSLRGFGDPFNGCTLLKQIAQSFNMSIPDYLRHQNRLKRERISRRVAVFQCLEFINERRIREKEEGVRAVEEAKRRRLNAAAGSSSSSSSSSSQEQQREEFNGVLAESIITAIELWRVIAMFL